MRDFWWAFPFIFSAMFLWELKHYFFPVGKTKRIRKSGKSFQRREQGTYWSQRRQISHRDG
jgi:hypothetical protein